MKSNTADKEIAFQRIRRLFHLARHTIHEDEELAQRYVALARKVSMVSRVRVPREFRRQMCQGCKRFILPGVSCRVRVQQHREPHLVITCGYCGRCTRIPLKVGKRKRK